LTEVQCPICGKVYTIPEKRGRAITEAHFLRHKDHCRLPAEDEFVRVGSTVAIAIELNDGTRGFPLLTVQYPSGRTRDFQASEVIRFEDQEEGRRRFYD
jgi:hypothetical protein